MQDSTQLLETTDLMNGLGIDSGLVGTMMTVGTVISILLTIVVIFYLVKKSAHHKKYENMTIEMAKNIQDIKALLEKQAAERPAASSITKTESAPDNQG